MYEKAAFYKWNWCTKKRSVAYGSSLFDYPKCFINRINEVYDFSIK